MTYTDINSKTIDSWVENGWEWSTPISSDDFSKAKNGLWREVKNMVLTPSKILPEEWLKPFLRDNRLDGVSVLGLASGGGQQMPIFAAMGAECTLLDYSDMQLSNDRMVAKREGYDISIVKADMTLRFPFEDESFDIIFHPVSNCYIEDVFHVWSECFRVLKSGGILLAGMDNGINFLTEDDNPLLAVNKLPYNPLKDRGLYERGLSNNYGIQFSHTIEEQLGGQLKAGFILTDLYEDTDNIGMGAYIPNYIATCAKKQ